MAEGRADLLRGEPRVAKLGTERAAEVMNSEVLDARGLADSLPGLRWLLQAFTMDSAHEYMRITDELRQRLELRYRIR